MRFRALFVLLALALALAGPARAQETAQTVLHLLDYIAIDYSGAVENGKVKSADEYKEMREFAGQTAALLKRLPAHPEQAKLLAEADALSKRIDAKAPPDEIAARASALRWSTIGAYNVQVSPKKAPDVKRGAELYASQCVACHGVEGKGDGPAGKGLEPAPANFHDAERMTQRSAYGLYNTISLGVTGTSMAPYQQLSDDDRWALAFFVATFAQDDGARAEGAKLWKAGKGRGEFSDLMNVATLSASDAKARFGNEAVAVHAYLIAHPDAAVAAKPAPIELAMAGIAKSVEAYRRGARVEATQLAIHAYLEGYELVEPNLKSADPELMTRAERAMIDYRGLLQAGATMEDVERQAALVQSLLADARTKLDTERMSAAAAFMSALLVLLREGAEAILVLAGILAFLGKTGRGDARRWVHLGWIAALVLGAATWAVSSYLVEISGASREVTEGVTSLVSAAMLIYVGYWLHSKSHATAWQKFIKDKVGGALSSGTVWMLAGISFLAVYREIFETVLFYEALAAQAGPESRGALFAGLGVAVVLLIGLAWVLLRASVRLPIGLFFSISGVLLVALAVIFTGQGVAALQKAGQISVTTIPFITVPLLGVYPTVQTLAAQVAVIAFIAVGLWWSRRHIGKLTTDDAR